MPNDTTEPAVKPKRPGRPPRAQATRRALEALQAAGINVQAVDPRVVLRAIAADVSAPASARVAAARELLRDQVDAELREESRRANERLGHV